LDKILIKKIEDKSIVWFENSNQYLILENVTADIVKRLHYEETIEEIAKTLEKKLAIPLEKAIDFVTDISDQIVKPNTSHKESNPTRNLEFTIPNSFEFVKYYQIGQKVLKVNYSNEFELYLIHPKFAHLEVSTSQEVDFTFQTFNNTNDTYLVLDDELIGSWSKNDIHYFQGKFSMKIIECIYEKLEEKWMGVFHASAINHQDNSILILGDSGNGKSTSLALLQAHDFHCIADDFVPIDDAENIHSFPAGISIKKNSLPVLLEHYPELRSSAEYHYKRLNKIVRYLPPKNIDYEKSFPCKALIFIKYDAHVEFECKEISKLNAFENLIPDSWISPATKNVDIFLHWFSSLPCYQLTYSNNQLMIGTVRKIFEDDV
jgi:hypothetical protein